MARAPVNQQQRTSSLWTKNDRAPPWKDPAVRQILLLFTTVVSMAAMLPLANGAKVGRCPSPIDLVPCATTLATSSEGCIDDADCSGSTRCCSDGCRSVCTEPLYSACEYQRLGAVQRARALAPMESTEDLPLCRPDGSFEAVQCSNASGECWCVSEAGFELAGTRAQTKQLVNCSAPRPCSGLMCRMLCPYDFELDSDGCPLCRCRDPCSNVHCPTNEECHLEDVPCAQEPCPPIPSCKQARHLSSICPFGEPLFLSEKRQPFLCGMEANQPQCPPFFTCLVQPNMDYGSCCPIFDQAEKPGKCPFAFVSVDQCGSECTADSECPGLLKCCSSEACGQHCVESNSSVCEQQQTLAKLLSRNEKAGRGYIPECTETGEFQRKQCSRNGLVCWCVDVEGNKMASTMGSAGTVSCVEDAVANPSRTACDHLNCNDFCEYGFQIDENNCPTCDCADPCDGFFCPAESKCVAVTNDSCLNSCSLIPSCQSMSVLNFKDKNCPATSKSACEKESTCDDDGNCPEMMKCCELECGHRCVELELLQSRLPTMCEYLRAYAMKISNTSNSHLLAYSIPKCTEEGMYELVQCNGRGDCWCVDEFGAEVPKTRAKSNQQPLDCSIVESRNHCLGLMCRLGCDYGFKKDDEGCPICECRNPCDGLECGEGKQCHLMEVDEDCGGGGGGYCPPVPQCLATRKSTLACPVDDPLVDTLSNSTLPCGTEDSTCPDSHFCIMDEWNVDSAGICCLKTDDLCTAPQELTFCNNPQEWWFYNNMTGHCEAFAGCGGNVFVTQTQCEMMCVVNRFDTPKSGVCPPIEMKEMQSCVTECAKDADCRGPQKCCLDGCGAFVCRDPKGSHGKAGQCPFLLSSPGSCELRCKSDYDCIDDLKCCSNGCGTKCAQPEMKTACEHQKAIAEYRMLELDSPVELYFVPKCRKEDGEFAPIQCSIANQTCWCVDESGMEVAGTRTYRGNKPDCRVGGSCSLQTCDLMCPYGPELDASGCPTCDCHDPCRDALCKDNEECRLVQVACSTEPCLPIPICLPKLENPCPGGEPLISEDTGLPMQCGPQGGQCPSTHQCNLSPLQEFSVCCPKLRDVCFQPLSVGQCERNVSRWYFDSTRSMCDEFQYGTCIGGNANNFKSKEQCEQVCPPLSACERLRQKNLWRIKTTQKEMFVPKCNPETHDWDKVQCLPSIGICWCVSPQGDIQPGTFTRGQPYCSSRQGRKMVIEEISDVCSNNETVHACPSNLCQGKVCLVDPDAECRINPCGGCQLEFYDNDGNQVDCYQGLKPCQSQMQQVLNSEVWANQRPLLRAKEVADEKVAPLLLDYQPHLATARVAKRDVFSEAVRSFLLGLLPYDAEEKSASNEDLTMDFTSAEELPSPADERQFHVPIRMGIWLPQCNVDGSFVPLQRSGPMAWCVHPNGEPIHQSLKQGRTHCDGVNNLTESEARLTCQENSRIPHVCTSECLNVICLAHPNATCSADPCDNCKITFTNDKGERLNCNDKCTQPVETGDCRASFRRWFFNQTTTRCEQFIYGGCQGNDNNFGSLEECSTECMRPVDVCRQPKRVGMCRASMHRWFYNAVTRKCEEFIFGGCDGNDNNFETEEECSAICPDVVVCPRLNENGELFQCSRVEACHNKRCTNQDDIVCTVDPCNNCSVYFVDLDGVQASCDIIANEIDGFALLPSEEPSESTTLSPARKTRCEKQHEWALEHGEHVPMCDGLGRFEPTQCEAKQTSSLQFFCWCVDEAGNQLQGGFRFVQGTHFCERQMIEKVEVMLAFSQPVDQQETIHNATVFKQAISHLVRSRLPLDANDIDVNFKPDVIVVKFFLSGEDKVDVAYALEEQMKAGQLLLLVEGYRLVAVHSASVLRHHLVASDDASNDTVEDEAISSASIILVVFITLLAMLMVCCLIAGVLVYRKKRMGTYPRGSLESLACSTSPLFESKKPPFTISSILSQFGGYEKEKLPQLSSVEHEHFQIEANRKI